MEKKQKKVKITIIIIFILVFVPTSFYKLSYFSNYNISENTSDKISYTSKQSTLLKDFFPSSIVAQEKNQVLVDQDLSNYVFIIFDESIQFDQRVSLIEKIDRNAEIKYNYKYLPVVSVKFSQDINNIYVNNQNFIYGIKKITNVHQTQFEAYDLSNLNENQTVILDDQENSDENLENWWLNAIGAENVPFTGKGVKIAIIDTGISVHPDFFENGNPKFSRIVANVNFSSEAGVLEKNYYFDDYGHGTHVAGIAAGSGYLSNGEYRGVAPQALLYNAKISNSSGFIQEDDVVAAIEWCIDEQVDIMSMSFGDVNPDVWTVQTLAIQKAVKKGILAFSSAGNSGPGFFTSGTPASGLYSIAVGATDKNNHVSYFSSWGPTFSNQLNPEICAPGVYIIAPLSKSSILDLEFTIRDKIVGLSSNFGYIPLSGTSMASPMAAGAAALLVEAFPDASPETIRNALILGASSLETKTLEGEMVRDGAGLINISKSLQILNEWNSSINGVNNNARLFPRIFPYSPFDFFKYPGEAVLLNYTLIMGSAKSIELELPQISGINFSILSDVSSLHEKVISIPIYAKILYNAIPGTYFGNFTIKDSESGMILDQIFFNISVEIPKAKIFFDSYHGLNDFFPNNISTYSQIDLYHLFYLLYSQGFQVIFNMEHWTPFYNASKDSPILSSEILSNIDILVLQRPVIPFSSYEIKEISNFYRKGGSILFLGTVNNLMCSDSINLLFQTLGINVSLGENMINLKNYGFFSQAINFNNISINKDSSIFSNISEFYYGFGTTFLNQSNLTPLVEVNGKNVAVETESINSSGKCILFGDYHFLTTSIFTSDSYYSNFSLLAENLFDYLIPNRSIHVDFAFKTQNRANVEIVPIKFYIVNSTSRDILSNFSIGTSLNCSLIYPNGTEISLIPIKDSSNFGYMVSISVNNLNYSKNPLIIKIKLLVNDRIYEDQYYYIYETPNFISSYKILSSIKNIDRIYPQFTSFSINSTDLIGKANMRAIIFPNSYFSKNNLIELFSNITESGTKSLISFYFNKLETAGKIILTPNYDINETIDRIDLFPNRIMFNLIDYLPEIIPMSSYIGDIRFNDISDGKYVSPVQIAIGQEIPLKVDIKDDDDSIINRNNFVITCSIFPGIIYHGIFNPMFPSEIWQYNLVFDQSIDAYTGNIVVYSEYQFPSINRIEKYTSESDYYIFYTMALISIIDPSGGVNYYPLFLIPYNKPIQLTNYSPVILLYGIIGIIIIVIQKKTSIFRKIFEKSKKEQKQIMYI
ncbi:S8 family peptidase [Candidatus Harpocratesius sp.]